jgi:hypothetical protein
MKSFLHRTLALASLLAFSPAISAVAQDRDEWYHNRDSFYHGEHWKARLFERIREDVEHVQSTTFPVSRDEFRLVQVKRELDELQNKMANREYDAPELDDVVHSLQKVVQSNRLSDRDRDVLNDDLEHLRDYRAHHEGWGRE